MSQDGFWPLEKKILKVWISDLTNFSDAELDEIYSFEKKKSRGENKANSFIMTMLSRIPHQIVAFDEDNTVSQEKIQAMVDSVPPFARNHTDGCPVYKGVDFIGLHKQTFGFDKSNTHEIESSNSDLRHHIPTLKRKSRCFSRKKENRKVVLSVFVNAYNQFGDRKLRTRTPVKHKTTTPHKKSHKWRYPTFSVLDFL